MGRRHPGLRAGSPPPGGVTGEGPLGTVTSVSGHFSGHPVPVTQGDGDFAPWDPEAVPWEEQELGPKRQPRSGQS